MRSILLTLVGIVLSFLTQAKEYKVSSPDGRIVVTVDAASHTTYRVDYAGRPVIAPTPMSMTFEGGRTIGVAMKVSKAVSESVNATITPTVPLKNAVIADKYNSLTLRASDYSIVFRVYDDGLAYRFVTDFKGDVKVTGESVSYNFTEDNDILFPEETSMYTHQERHYLPLSLRKIEDGRFCSPPMLVMTKGEKINMLITEADLESYPGIYYEKSGPQNFVGKFPYYPAKTEIKSDRDMPVTVTESFMAKCSGKREYPWRVAIVTDRDERLVESEMVYKLAKKSQLADTGWIKPGKVAWDWWNDLNITGVDFKTGVNTETYKYFVDFASANGIPYIILDEGWYDLSDIMKVAAALNMEELVSYAKAKNVGLILWTTWLALDKKMDEALAQFGRWGIKGLKIDFMQRDDQWMVDWYYNTAKKAAALQMMVDYHGAYKPTGLHRTYPNMMTSEGVYGMEQNKWTDDQGPQHTVTLPFIRMVAGPMDYTPGAMRNASVKDYHPSHSRPMSLGTRCHQLGMYVVYESPLQMLSDTPTNYEKEPECMEFLRCVPTTWDKSVCLGGSVGKYVIMAREKDGVWYIGGMSDWDAKDIEISLSFLPEGKWKLKSWTDGINAGRNAEDFKVSEHEVGKNDKITVKFASGGGYAAVIVPVK